MPAADELVPDFDEVDLHSAPPPVEEETPFAATPRKSKKKKGRKNVEALLRPADEEDAAYTQSIPPSYAPLEEPSVQNDVPEPEPLLADEPAPPPPPAADDEDGGAEIGYREQPPEPSSAPKPSPVLSSPRPAAAKPVASSLSPQSRPSSLHGPLPQYSSYRPSTAPTYPRRESTASRTSPRPRFVEPAAPPHMAQPHFYGLPDLGLNFGQKKEQAGKAAGSDGYCCCFDSFADSGDAASSKKARTALLVGSEGGLEVFRVLPNKFEVVGRLEGLRGSVIGAKVLPHVQLFDGMQAARPLVAVIVHGGLSGEKSGDAQEPHTHYQTTVEVYSLQSQEHIATLYKSVPVAIEQPTLGHLSPLPAPVGDLSIAAKGTFVVIASGKSGEIFVFSSAANSIDADPQFRCIGKFWTTLQSRLDTSRPPSSSDASQPAEDDDERPGVPLFSLSQRWLALVAPATSSLISIQGAPLLSEHNSSPHGLATHVAPPLPHITCDIAGVDSEGTWSRLTRQAAQSVVKYSQKGIEMGWQGWKELTNPTTQSGQQHGRTASKDDQFPPTKAPPDDPRRYAKEPAIVSIIDLETLLDTEEQKPKYPPPPLSTFALEEGCNFLSFSSSGTRLLTVSRKGEISMIWDLSQANHGRTTREVAGEGKFAQGPCIKQIHRIPRSSQSVVVGSAWTRDDDFLALLTTHGTVHLHEVPAHPPSRKRKRRSTIPAPAPEKAQPTVGVSQGLSPPSSNGFLSSFKSGWQQMSTQVNTIRSQNPVSSLGIPMSFAGFKETAANASQAGGRALAKGLSQGYSAAKGGASDYWHSEDNKIRHKGLHDHVGPGSLRWIKRQSGTVLAVACGGTVHLHPVQKTQRWKGDALVSGLKHDKYGRKHFELPPIRTSSDGSGPQIKKADDCMVEGPHGFWSLRLSPVAEDRRRGGSGAKVLPSQANEVETNPPYCPFHVGSRINIFAFEDATSNSQLNLIDEPSESLFHTQGHGLNDEEPWIFGEARPLSTKMNTQDDDVVEFDFREGVTDSDLEEVAEQVESRLTVHAADEPGGEQIRINTRRTQGKPGSGGRGDGEFDMLEDYDDDSEM